MLVVGFGESVGAVVEDVWQVVLHLGDKNYTVGSLIHCQVQGHHAVAAIGVGQGVRIIARLRERVAVPMKRQLVGANRAVCREDVLGHCHLESVNGRAAVAVRDSVGHQVVADALLKIEGVAGHVCATV